MVNVNTRATTCSSMHLSKPGSELSGSKAIQPLQNYQPNLPSLPEIKNLRQREEGGRQLGKEMCIERICGATF